MKRISIKGVVLGSITDIVATNVLTLPVIIYLMATQGLASVPNDQLSHALAQSLRSDPFLFSAQLAVGALCSVLGGYVAARIAKRHEILNGALAAFLCVGSGLYGLLFSSVSAPLWQYMVGFAASPALSAFGGYLRSRAKRRTELPFAPAPAAPRA